MVPVGHWNVDVCSIWSCVYRVSTLSHGPFSCLVANGRPFLVNIRVFLHFDACPSSRLLWSSAGESTRNLMAGKNVVQRCFRFVSIVKSVGTFGRRFPIAT